MYTVRLTGLIQPQFEGRFTKKIVATGLNVFFICFYFYSSLCSFYMRHGLISAQISPRQLASALGVAHASIQRFHLRPGRAATVDLGCQPIAFQLQGVFVI